MVESTENQIIDELTEMFEKKYLDQMDSSYSVMSASGDDELSFKAWQSCKNYSKLFLAESFLIVLRCFFSEIPRFGQLKEAIQKR